MKFNDGAVFIGLIISMMSVLFGAMLISDHLTNSAIEARNEAAIKMVGDGADPLRVMCLLDGINQHNREICSK